MQIKGTASPPAAGSGEEGSSGFNYNEGSWPFLQFFAPSESGDSLNAARQLSCEPVSELQTKCRLHAPPSLPLLDAGAHLPLPPPPPQLAQYLQEVYPIKQLPQSLYKTRQRPDVTTDRELAQTLSFSHSATELPKNLREGPLQGPFPC